MVYRNNADLGKGVPRPHVFHEAWELLFFLCDATGSNLPVPRQPTSAVILASESQEHQSRSASSACRCGKFLISALLPDRGCCRLVWCVCGSGTPKGAFPGLHRAHRTVSSLITNAPRSPEDAEWKGSKDEESNRFDLPLFHGHLHRVCSLFAGRFAGSH